MADSKFLHIKGSRTQVYKTLPSNDIGNDGDIILSQIQGRGVYLCSKVNGRWHVSSKMEELRKIEKTSTKDFKTDKLRVLDDLSIGRGTTQITKDEAKFSSSLKIKEAANAISDTAAYGQLWVKTATPNELYFTTDAGDDIQITSGTATAFVGDITGVTAGDGLSGGGNSGTVSLAVSVDDSTIETNSDSLRIKDSGVTYAKIQNVTNARMLGNNSGGAAAPSEMTQANVLSFLGVEAGATADQTKSDIDGLAITTVGTIDTGTWEGTTIAVDQGGTGATSLNNLITLSTHTTGNYVATLTAGALIDLQNNTGEGATPTIDVDLTELTDGTADVVGSADELVYLDDGVQKRKQIDEIKLGQFNNDAGWEANVSGDSGNAAIYDNSGTPTLKSGITQGEMQTAIGGVYTDTINMGSGFTVSATTDSNATTITQGDDLMFAAGTGITCETTADGTVTITNTVSDTNTTYSAGSLLDLSTTTFNVDLTEAAEAAIADGDYILFLDGGATGTHAKEAVADLATLFAGDGLTASSSVLAVNVDDSTIETNSDALRVKDSGITLAKMANIADNTMIGLYDEGSSATPVALNATQIRALINVANGATANIGDITSVTAGTNCSGGGTSGGVTINVDDAFLVNDADDTMAGTLTIDKNSTATTNTTTNGLLIDYDHTGVTASGQLITNVGLDINVTDSSPTHVGTHINYGIKVAATSNTSGTGMAYGIYNTTTGGDINYGYGSLVSNGSNDFIMFDSADTNNYATISTGADGATVIETVDNSGAVGHLTLDVDGDITLDAASGNIYVKDNGGNYTPGSDYEIATKKYVDDNDANTTYSGGTNLTLSSTTFNVDDAFLVNDADDTTSGTITAGGFTTTGTWTFDTSAGGTTGVTQVNVGSAFTDNDTTLMSAGAIKEKIEDYGYTTNTGDITGVDLTAGTGISIDSETNTTSGSYSATITCNVEGTEIVSTGETGGSKFLREDGDGTCSWQTVSGGGGGSNFITDNAADVMTVTDFGANAALKIDANQPSTTASEDSKGLWIDYDRTQALSGTGDHNDIGIDLDVNAGSLGTSTVKGMDIDVVGTTAGTSTATGIDVNVSGSDTKIGLDITAATHIKMTYSADSNDYGTISVGNTGDMTIASTGDEVGKADITLSPNGNLIFDAIGDIYADSDIGILSTKKLYFDANNAGGGAWTHGDTTIYNSDTDELTIEVGGIAVVEFKEIEISSVSTGYAHFPKGVGFTQFEPTYDALNTIVSFAANGHKAFFTFGSGNITNLNLIFPNVSCNCTMVIKQDASGSRTVTNWKSYDQSSTNQSTVKWAGASAPTLSTGANRIDIVSFYWDNDNHTAYGVISQNFN